MKVIIAGGGTGGHVFPAISIAEEIARRDPGNEILFVGTKSGLENELLGKRGFKIRHISSGGIVGKGISKSLSGFFSAAKGVVESASLIREFKPDFVLGVGGYVSGPLVLSASLLNVPTAICEQNTVPGLTNRILGRFVKRVFASFEGSYNFFDRKKVMLTGNPIRQEILQNVGKVNKSEPLTCLVFGGSQGARKLNSSVPEALSLTGHKDLYVIHQTGRGDLQSVKDAYEQLGISAEVIAFIDDMAGAYARSDFVIGRAGAGTVAEITALGKPSLLVPFPHATHNHQYENARALESAGAALLVRDEYAEPKRLARALDILLNKDKLNSMAENACKLGRPGAAAEIVDEISKMAGVT